MTLSLCYPRVLKRGSTLSFEFASSRGTSQQIKACPLLCFTKTLWCVCVLVCVNCWLLSSQQLYISICVLCFAERGRLYACVRRSCEPVCVNGLSPLALALRVCTRWQPLTYRSICAPPRGHPILSHRRLFIRPPVYDMQRGTLFLPLTMETGHVPHSFFTSSKPSVCLRDAVASEQVSSPLDKPVVLHPFHLDSVSGVDPPKKIIARKKKKTLLLAAVKGCMLAAFIHEIFDVCFMLERLKKTTTHTSLF